ncbi:hypothetical protein AVEN_59019-1 [Araneus ventricosus]|uniref:Uncharacterized protein n=1 Tax=Araneus ventricosus TaxID=182803 RepID=A0A4Y2X364_ARAVE|nr:hypothetical protein AVEN_59019-1 [Araneus ventricosus]
MVVIKSTLAKVASANGERRKCAGINNCQTQCIWFGYQEISGVLSWDTCLDLVVRKSRNHPTVGNDHWGDRRLVIGRMAVRLSSGKKGRRSSTLQVRTKRGCWTLRRGEL